MYEEGKALDQKFAGVEIQIYPTDYHTLSCPVFVLEDTPQGGKNW